MAQLGIGAAGQAVMIQSTNQHLYLVTELAAKVEKLEREFKAWKTVNRSTALASGQGKKF